jgi:para-nitrobenzyl esterase
MGSPIIASRGAHGWALAAALAAALGHAAVAQTNGDDPTIVQTEDGKVRGAVEDDVLVWKGIPFALPPVGDLRWRAPQPAQAWDGVRDATAFGNNPVQLPSEMPLGADTSEDCLYLNVWRPAQSEGKPLPVMVWIYGGGLVRGGASLYPGACLARQGIVVVTFNYRLGRLGFFAHPALAREADEARGNYGYMDQIAALQWVKRNIAAFGGDPGRVTIAGESAGGGSVLVLLTSPRARGLFHRAIVQSAGLPTARAHVLPLRDLGAAEAIGVAFARAHGIEGDGRSALRALRDLPVEKLIEGTEGHLEAAFGGAEILGLSQSILDGRLVVEPPEIALRAGRWAKVPVITGANDFDLAASPAKTKEALFAPFGALVARAQGLYDPKSDGGFDELMPKIVADRTMVEPSRHLAELVTKSGQPAYFYRFAYVPEAQRRRLRGAVHGAEILFAFDAVAEFMKEHASAADVEMGDVMSAYWVAFVKSGDPNGEGRPNWPRFNPAVRHVLTFGSDGVQHGADPLQERLDLWRELWDFGP